MAESSEINVGLLGLGVVGGGVANALAPDGDALIPRTGRTVNLKKVLVQDLAKSRDTALPSSLLTTNPEEILTDPDIHVVIEVMGGVQPATRYLKDALTSGKHVVTANKEAMAKHGPELLSLAEKNRLNLLFEASVGGGIPIVGCLMNELLANEVRSIRGIINGTTNYILTRMAYHNADFSQALGEAQTRGYAESDPTNDIEGTDAVYKLAILASLAFHQRFQPEDIFREGIARLEPEDFRYARELGFAIKSLAVASVTDGSVLARVYPALIPVDHMLAKVDGVYNAVEVDGNLCGQVLFHGMGAGREPTTSAVLGDLIEVVRRMGAENSPASVPQPSGNLGIKSIDDLQSRYYLRLNVSDQPGVLAQIARLLGDGRISLASVLQTNANPEEKTAEIVITTHPAREAAVQESLKQMRGLEVVREINNLIRIED